jgi:hypothetical protein
MQHHDWRQCAWLAILVERKMTREYIWDGHFPIGVHSHQHHGVTPSSRLVAPTVVAFFIFGASPVVEAGKGGKGGPPNRAPKIEGTPATTARVGEPYEFSPTASDPDGDPLSFSIQNQPGWTSFDNSIGRIFGTPQATDIGRSPGVTITVSDGLQESSLTAFEIEVVDEASNLPPEISGNPPTEVMVGQNYSFTPTASDQDGDELTFSIENKPNWSGFSSTNGTLSGTPTEADVGVTSSIIISVSDSQENISSLGPFDLQVQSQGTGENSATLTWIPPTEQIDGAPLTNIAGYGIAYGKSSGEYDRVIEIDNPGITTVVVENLNHGTWFFVAYVYDGYGLMSDFSNEVSKEIAKTGGPGPGKGKN